MCDKYDVFLHRMAEYRTKMDITQVEVSDELGITQSQLSKMELGKTIYSFKVLQCLYAQKWDIDYFITGKKYNYVVSEVSHMIDEAAEKTELLQLVAWAFEHVLQKSNAWNEADIQFEVRLLKQRAHVAEAHSLLYDIKVVSGVSQPVLADKIGVNIKKYRLLERNKINPDAELLLRIYEETGCRPGLWLDPDNVDKMIISDLWQLIPPQVQEEILLLMKQGMSVLEL
ncbi:MAG: transcriptional regulator [Lachnospiraceae bacterium]|nr:transcriptional regulator [Lachnospiraceae bacterium]